MRGPATCEVRILGGLWVQAKVWIAPPDPSVGIFQSQIDDYELFWPSGHSFSQKMYDRVLAHGGEEKLFEAIWDEL